MSAFLIFAWLVSITTSTTIQPTVTNATGDYYIADESSFINNAIQCNRSQACYVICPLQQSCNNTKISCSSAKCSLTCSALESCLQTSLNINYPYLHSVDILCTDSKSCHHTNINATASNISTFTATCTNTTSCYNNSWTLHNFQSVFINHNGCKNCFANTYTLEYINNINILRNTSNDLGYARHGFWDIYNIKNSDNINMSCVGEFSCLAYEISTNNTQTYSSLVNINCENNMAYSCMGMAISQSTNDKLNLNCKHTTVCDAVNVLASPISKHTHITCNGNIQSKSCNGLNISVPSNYDNDFVVFEFINDRGTNMAGGGSFDNVKIQCLDAELCTNYTTFPLIYGTAQPTVVNGNKVYYYGNASYMYQFQSLSCKSGQECVFDCAMTQSCANSFIECEAGSKCDIYCNNSYNTNQCQRTVVKAYGDDIDLRCNDKGACNNAKVWIPGTFNNGYLDISTCNQYESCDYLQFMCMNNTSQFNWNGARYVCENEDCCPWHTNTNDTYKNITCVGNDCSISCNNNWGNPYYPPFGCGGLIIDGTASNTLHLNCSSDGSCQNAIIYCPKGVCNISCGIGSCVNTTIYSDSTDNINIGCFEENSCKGTNINVNNIGTFNLNCSGIEGCESANVVVNASNKVNIKCKFCKNINIWLYANDSQIICQGDSQNNDLAAWSCRNALIQSVLGNNLSVSCTDTYSCENATIISNLTTDVFIDCTCSQAPYGYGDSCDDAKIYAYSFNNLKINCNKSSCIDTYVEAIGNNNIDMELNNNVSLRCIGYDSCIRLKLNTNYVANVSAQCMSWVSCVRTIFNSTNAKYFNLIAGNDEQNTIQSMSDVVFNIKSVEYVSFDFSKGQSGDATINVNDISNINIACNNSNNTNMLACQNIQLYANNINDSVNIFCDGNNACQLNQFMVGNVYNSVNVWCTEAYSCTMMKVRAINSVNNFNVTCANGDACDVIIDAKYANLLNVHSYSNNMYGSYYKMTIITPQNPNSTNIYCGDTGCWDENFIISNENGLTDLHFIWSGNCECSSVTDCIDEWNITCSSDTGITRATFDGSKCYGNSKCCNNENIMKIDNAFNDYFRGNISNCYSPKDKKSDTGLIIGLIIGAVFVTVFGVVFVILYWNRKKKIADAMPQQEYQQIN